MKRSKTDVKEEENQTRERTIQKKKKRNSTVLPDEL